MCTCTCVRVGMYVCVCICVCERSFEKKIFPEAIIIPLKHSKAGEGRHHSTTIPYELEWYAFLLSYSYQTQQLPVSYVITPRLRHGLV